MNLFLRILFIALICSTLCICVSKPQMHNKVLVYNSDYTLVQEEIPEIEEKELPVIEQTIKIKPTTKIKKETYKKEITPKVKKQNKIEKKVVTKPTEPVKKVTPKVTPKKIKIERKETTPAPVLTEKEEIIAWNVWRSNLQNRIMNDVNMPILPNGVIFKFTFTVDKFGKITNVQTWSPNPGFTPYAIQHIAPVIRSYQGKDILDFPAGSNRNITDVTGGWKISSSSKYSRPEDYNDLEKVKN